MLRSLFALLLLTVASIASGASFVIGSDRALVGDAEAIVIGRAGESHGRMSPGGLIETVTAFQTVETIKGNMPAGVCFDLVRIGGTIGTVTFLVEGSPQIAAGERALLFLARNPRGEWTLESLALGLFRFGADDAGSGLLLRDAVDGWTPEGQAYREPLRAEGRFLEFVRSEVAGHSPAADYVVTRPFRAVADSLHTAVNAVAGSTYLLTASGPSGNLGLRWKSFPTAQVFFSLGSQPGATSGGLTALQRAFAAWTNDGASNIVYQYGGTTTLKGGLRTSDSRNTVLFNDPNGEVAGAFNDGGSSSSVLAVGGPWYDTSVPHTFNGEQFYTIFEGDLIVQNGITGPGLTGNGLDHVMTHELGHTLGLRHSDEPPAGGTSSTSAIMNSSVSFNSDPFGASLQPWDREAISAVYGSGTVTPPSCVAPAITTQPPSLTLTASVTVALNVAASGTAPFSYQWYIGAKGVTSQPIAGATGATLLALPTVTTSYWVRVSNGCAPAADSNAAVVTINGCPLVTIATQPQNQSILRGSGATLAVSVPGSGYAYQWFQGLAPDSSSPVAGGASATVTVFPAASTLYWARITNACGSFASSSSASVTVTQCDAAAIAGSPSSRSVVSGTSVTLTVVTAGTGPLSYQWYAGVAPNINSPIAGATTQSLITGPLIALSAYWCRVKNACGSADSSTAVLSIVASCEVPAIRTQPADRTVAAGESASLAIDASGTGLQFRWYQGSVLDFSHPVGLDSPTLTTEPINEPTSYWVRVTNDCGSVNSTAATVSPGVPNARRRSAHH